MRRMAGMVSDPDPTELYAHSTMHFGMAGGSQSKEEAWSVQTHMNAQISIPGITLPNATRSTQHDLQFCPLQDYLPPFPPMNSLHLHSTSVTGYNSGDMIHQPPEEMVDYGSPHIGLSLTQQTYYSSADTAASFNHMLWRSRFGYLLGHQPPRCQADGCKADLSDAKRYHRRHKVCEFHSKASVVVVGGGQQQRFCQQCSRFHSLDEFDEAKKSCRKRLADHNRRRRKLQPPSLSSTTDPQARAKTTLKKKAAPRDINGTTTSMRKIGSDNKSVSKMDKTGTKASSSKVGSGLSLGTVGEQEKPWMSSIHNQFNHEEVLHDIREDSGRLQVQQQFSPFSHSAYHGAFQSARGGPDMSYQQQSSLFHNGQLMFGLDFI